MQGGSRADTEPATRDALVRAQRLRTAISGPLRELKRSDVTLGRFGMVEHTDGSTYRIVRGEVVDALFSPAVAYFVNANGDVVFLEPQR